MNSIRHRYEIRCHGCIKKKHLAIERAKQKEAKQKAERKAKAKADELEKHRRIAFCEECGQEFMTFISSKKYCCKDCRIRHNRRKRKDKRFKDMDRDFSITVKSLYERDKGICWICGKKCDLDDYTVRPDGTIICGKNYPSVDYIIPVSEGGKDRWNNVRLAHRSCNAKRYQDERRKSPPGALKKFDPKKPVHALLFSSLSKSKGVLTWVSC